MQNEIISEQHSYLPPQDVDFIKIQKNREGFQLFAVLNDDAAKAHLGRGNGRELEIRPCNQFDTAKEARSFCKMHYKGVCIEVA